ncbi:hypothetical protein SLS62_004295 [Diatrype stigma]|uniref:N-acetyltransferase domain-containing protein n=1 Tax=Diatrype stigma TaxID=117547 RepID=A0AAN9UTF1_9PEZI
MALSPKEGFKEEMRQNLKKREDDAVDDSEDLDDDYVEVQKTISGGRRRQSKSLVQVILPFTFSPLTRPLTIRDADCCEALEKAAFTHPEHRCSRDKFEYRLSVCPELSLGVFCTVVPSIAEEKGFQIDTFPTAKKVETARPNGAKSVLFAHIIATKTDGQTVTDRDMDYPRDWRTRRANATDVGHKEAGRTICLHSLAVHPKLQGCNLGKMLMKAYLQQVKNSGLADRISLIAQEDLVKYYIKHGFQDLGPSKVTFGGGGWHDMV